MDQFLENRTPLIDRTQQELLRLEKISLRDGEKYVFDDLEFSLLHGEVHAVVSIQTDVLDRFLKMLRAEEKEVSGIAVLRGERYSIGDFLRRSNVMAYILQENLLFGDFSILENIYYDELFSFEYKPLKYRSKCEQLLREIDIDMNLDQKVWTLSAEEQKFVEFLRFFLGRKPIAILYETVIRMNIDLMLKFGKLIDIYKKWGKSIIFATSSLDEALKISDRVSVLDSGKISNTFQSADIRRNPQKVFHLLSGWTYINNVQKENNYSDEEANYLETFESLIQIRNISFSTYELSNVLQSLANNIKNLMQADSCNIYLAYEKDIIKFSGDYQKNSESTKLKSSFINDFKSYMKSEFVCNIHEPDFIKLFEQTPSCKATVCVPILLESERAGILQISYNHVYSFTKRESVLLGMLNREISMAVETSRLLGRSTLLQESHHRIKNNLQTIINLLYMQEAVVKYSKSIDFSAIVDTIVNRIKSIASVHDLITKEKTTPCLSMKNIVGKVLEIYECQKVNFTLDVDDIELPYTNATSIALLINELISNSTKHAFANKQRKEIMILCKRNDEIINLSVADNGRGLPQNFDFDNIKSVGMSIIKSVVLEMGAKIEFTNKRGTDVTISIPRNAFSLINSIKFI